MHKKRINIIWYTTTISKYIFIKIVIFLEFYTNYTVFKYRKFDFYF